MEDIRFGKDRCIWDILQHSDDPIVKGKMHKIKNVEGFHCFVDRDEAHLHVVCKFRGIDPFVIVEGKRVRFTSTDSALAKEYQLVKDKMAKGWSIKLNP